MKSMIANFTNSDPLSLFYEFFIRVIVAVLAVFSDARTLLHAVLFLIMIDQVMGVTFAIKDNKFNWHEFNKVYRKVLIYISVILAAFIYERYLLGSDAIYFTKIMASLVGFQEISSAYVKFAKMTGIKVFQKIFDKIK